MARCWWGASTPDYQVYHDTEWGFPVDDDHRLFEKLCLEGFQSGLSWLTVLRKRPDFRRVFHDFDPQRVAAMGAEDVTRLLADATIIRHRGKIEAAIANAAAAREVAVEWGTLAAFFWSFEPPERPPSPEPTSAESTELAKELKRRRFRFVGPTTAHAFMQATGIVNDHVTGCATGDEVASARQLFVRPIRSVSS
ncbi:MAG: DNA-3-methyladenine glycosylase I [Actinomycetota bacterium]|nr:DNA-3-methyladenine glycosylase I [Actinomycetota bacterium]